MKWPPICQLFAEKFATAPSRQHLALNRPSPSKRRKFLALPRTGERCRTGGRKLQKPAKRPNKKSVGHPSSDRPPPTASDATIRGKKKPQSCRHAIRVAFSKRIVHIHTHARKKGWSPVAKNLMRKSRNLKAVCALLKPISIFVSRSFVTSHVDMHAPMQSPSSLKYNTGIPFLITVQWSTDSDSRFRFVNCSRALRTGDDDQLGQQPCSIPPPNFVLIHMS